MSATARQVWRWLRPVLRRERTAIMALLLWSALGALPVLLSGMLVATALDRGFLAADPVMGFRLLACYAAAMAVGAFAGSRVILPAGRIADAARDHILTATIAASLRRAVHQQGGGTGAVARITTQTERARTVLSGLLLTGGSVGLSLCAAVIGLAGLAPVVAVLVLPLMIVAALLLVRLTRAWRHRCVASLRAEEELSDRTGRVVAGLRDVVACGAHARTERELDASSRRVMRTSIQTGDIGGVRVGLLGLTARAPLIALLAAAPWLLANGTLSTGALIGAAYYLVSGLEPAVRTLVETLGNSGVELVVVLGTLAEPAPTEPPRPPARTLPRHYDLTLHKTTFRYGPHSTPVLDEADLWVPAGQHLAVVGPSGIGKSTLASLLAGLTTAEQGEVLLGGIPVADVRSDVQLLPQEAYVFAGTLRENLSYLAPGVSDERLIETLHTLGAAELLSRQEGLGGVIDTATTLSHGQRQLIALTRCYLSPSRVLILDEATCHLDPAAEAHVERALAARVGTLIIIAHRMSSALRADRVVVLDGYGLLAGTHEELVRSSATYADLVGHWQAKVVD